MKRRLIGLITIYRTCFFLFQLQRKKNRKVNQIENEKTGSDFSRSKTENMKI